MSANPAKSGPAFDQFAETYDRALAQGLSLSGENRDYFARARVQLLNQRLFGMAFSATTVMDFGCGDGSSTSYLLELRGAKEIVGVDVSAASIQRAKERHPIEGLSFRSLEENAKIDEHGRFELVFCNGVFHHIPPNERIGVISLLLNALRPGGVLALWENNPWNPGTRLVMSRIPFDRDAITLSYWESKKLLTAGGFQIVLTDFAFYFPRFLSMLRFTEGLLRKVPLGAQYLVIGRKP
jgi:SAM-dependent methyltransferase